MSEARFDLRVLISCSLCGRLLVIPPGKEALCPGCQDRQRRLLELPKRPRRKRAFHLRYLRP